MLSRIKAALVAAVKAPVVRSVIRHAALAAFAVLVAANGSYTTAVLVAAAAAGGRAGLAAISPALVAVLNKASKPKAAA